MPTDITCKLNVARCSPNSIQILTEIFQGITSIPLLFTAGELTIELFSCCTPTFRGLRRLNFLSARHTSDSEAAPAFTKKNVDPSSLASGPGRYYVESEYRGRSDGTGYDFSIIPDIHSLGSTENE